MLVEAAISNLFDPDAQQIATIDWLDLDWASCLKRAMKKRTRGDRDVRILLKLGVVLRHGDVLWTDQSTAIAVNVLPCDVVVIKPRDATESTTIAYELGNLHVPAQLCDGEIITIPDGPIEAILDRLGVSYEFQRRRFEPTLRNGTQIALSANFEITRKL